MTAYLDDTNGSQTGVQLGSAWMSGYGPAADASGNVYVATGNGAYDGIASFSMSVLKLPGNLDLAAHDSFTPATQAKDSAYDLDLGSGGVMLLPDQNVPAPHQLIAGGKCSYHDAGVHQNCWKFILNRDRLGGFASGNTGALWAGDTGGWMLGGPAYFQDAAGVAHIIYGGQPLYDYTLREPAGGPPSLSASTYANVGCLVCAAGGGSQPIISSNGVRSGTAIAWAVKANPSAGGTLAFLPSMRSRWASRSSTRIRAGGIPRAAIRGSATPSSRRSLPMARSTLHMKAAWPSSVYVRRRCGKHAVWEVNDE